MHATRKKPTRTDLLAVIGSLQNLIGAALEANHDRNPNSFAQTTGHLNHASELCIEARGYDPPTAGDRSPWVEPLRKPKV